MDFEYRAKTSLSESYFIFLTQLHIVNKNQDIFASSHQLSKMTTKQPLSFLDFWPCTAQGTSRETNKRYLYSYLPHIYRMIQCTHALWTNLRIDGGADSCRERARNQDTRHGLALHPLFLDIKVIGLVPFLPMEF
jgi:hypothetical protein